MKNNNTNNTPIATDKNKIAKNTAEEEEEEE